ncbi:MAG: murein DD-endopeptidase MepM/ murein hydrolase activator NlpD, partial [Colwellia sp.]
NIPVIFPAKDYYISSLFGIRKDPMLKHPAMHKGIDMAGWLKTEIFASADGTVRRAGINGSYGRFIEIDHHNGFMTRFGHLHKIKVKKGQEISKDDVIGLMGSSGRSTSTHLHYEVLFNNKQINPLSLIKALKNVL